MVAESQKSTAVLCESMKILEERLQKTDNIMVAMKLPRMKRMMACEIFSCF